MKTYKRIRIGFPLIALLSSAFIFSSCYTVLKQSGEYYSEFGQNSSDKSEVTGEDLSQPDSLAVVEDSSADLAENPETVIIDRYYYDSPWWSGYGYGYPGRYWGVSIGYSWYPTYGYTPYDYYYWGGCYYPAYPGYYPYYPDPWYNPGTYYPSYTSRRNYGMRHDVLNSSGSGFIRMNSISSTSVLSQRQYNTGTNAGSKSTTAAQNKKTVKETKQNKRRFNTKSGTTASKPVEKANTGNNKRSGKREYKEVDIPKNNNQSMQRGFENAKSHFTRNDNSSSREFNNSNSSSNSSRSSGTRSSSPNINRTYNSKR
jgi:hypothetical protein